MSIFISLWRVLALCILVVIPMACTNVTEERNGGKMNLTTYCKETVCESERKECLDRVDERCSRCYDLCEESVMYDSDSSCFDTCDRACDSTVCYSDSCKDSPCLEKGFKFKLPDRRDESLYKSCIKLINRDMLCENYKLEEEVIYQTCDIFARVINPQINDEIECESSLGCEAKDADFASCWTEPIPEGELGDKVCLKMEELCYDNSCSEQWREDLNLMEAIFLTDVKEALLLCLNESSCDDIKNCFNSWAEAVNL